MTRTDTALDPKLRMLIVAVLLGGIMAILDSTMIAVAVETLGREFQTGLATVGWVSTGYLLALVVTIPVTAWAVSRFGAPRMWFVGLAVFLLASLACALAWNFPSLLVFRILQGVGAGIVDPLVLILLARRCRTRPRRARHGSDGCRSVPRSGPRPGTGRSGSGQRRLAGPVLHQHPDRGRRRRAVVATDPTGRPGRPRLGRAPRPRRRPPVGAGPGRDDARLHPDRRDQHGRGLAGPRSPRARSGAAGWVRPARGARPAGDAADRPADVRDDGVLSQRRRPGAGRDRDVQRSVRAAAVLPAPPRILALHGKAAGRAAGRRGRAGHADRRPAQRSTRREAPGTGWWHARAAGHTGAHPDRRRAGHRYRDRCRSRRVRRGRGPRVRRGTDDRIALPDPPAPAGPPGKLGALHPQPAGRRDRDRNRRSTRLDGGGERPTHRPARAVLVHLRRHCDHPDLQPTASWPAHPGR
ncbi:Multidrug resistance protein B [Pseudonocardia sp. Ae406_Ps2]|nr:Multidrug resistance protein B [Pseudonocardia sp. Ae406_Ps2]OLM06944.1 Multidrug resistance protein B [Pseudonocardia sp. Ae331_Ps2]OLM22832.1 Multidrug resistance protein B [Pseudonocardia sp. Ae706_Ps2]